MQYFQDMTIPPEFQQVIDAWIANAKEKRDLNGGDSAWPDDCCCVGFEEDEGQRGSAWTVSCFYGTANQTPTIYWFPEQDVWLLCPYYGSPRPIKGGLSEAIETAGMVYTGICPRGRAWQNYEYKPGEFFRFEYKEEIEELEGEAEDRGITLAQVIQECVDEQNHVGAAEDSQWTRDNDPDWRYG